MALSARVQAQAAFLQDVAKLIQWFAEKGFVVTGGELFRSPEQQKIYVESGRSQTMQSLHLDRMAVDLNIFDSSGNVVTSVDVLKPAAIFWESLHPNNSWGGMGRKLVDTPHFSRGWAKPEWRRLT